MRGDRPVSEGADHDEVPEFVGDLPLDAAQQLRIQATHRGFTYQHLYAVGCLLRLRDAGAQTLLVERDEDLEVVLPGRQLYLQVKTRQSGVLVWSDIRDAVEQFQRKIRAEHDEGRRSGSPVLVVVSNAQPGPALVAKTRTVGWPGDVQLLWPGGPAGHDRWLPPPAGDLDGMLQWCTAEAERVPFLALKPQTLVEKLAARVQYASTGARGQAFVAADLPGLFEQFVEELQAFPEVPEMYWPQKSDPELVGEQRVRLVVGYSGAGKTTWAAHAAERCPLSVTYCDVADGVSTEAVAESMARELAARHLSSLVGGELPHGSSVEVLRAVHLRLTRTSTVVAVVLDNAHRLPTNGIRMLVDALPTVHLILLAQPWPDQTVLEAHLGITAQMLPGWTVDTIAEALAAEGCRTDYLTARRVCSLTGGLPLYVLQAAALTRSEYNADAAAFCNTFEERTHFKSTAQELILEQSFGRLNETAKKLAGLLAFAEVRLTRDELQQLAAEIGAERAPDTVRAARELAAHGLTQPFADGHLKLHDAVRPLAASVEEFGEEAADRLLRTLCRLLEGHKGPDRLSRWMRLLGSTGQIDELIALTEQEGFFERGYPREVRAMLADTAHAPDADTALRFDAHNALSVWAHRDGDLEALAVHVQAMETLHRAGHPDFGQRERMLLAGRRFYLYGESGDIRQLKTAYVEAQAQTPAPSRYDRALRYGYAAALWTAGQYEEAGLLAMEVALAYMDHLGLEDDDLLTPKAELHAKCVNSDTPDDFKRLADCFGLAVLVYRKLNRMDFAPWAVRAHKLYAVSGATRSAINSGQDVADVLRLTNPGEALKILDTLMLAAEEENLQDVIIGLRSQRAEVLARTGDIEGARTEISILSQYDLTNDQAMDIRHQSQLIEESANDNT
ncbi:ATP-binding protein [Streptomyces parvus]|uniref:ATP-binding protein n=1 Tax=Streptomyces parvus TaxID=66428 RepID=A0A5D4JGA3_9ACTN|nr:ATP-binding protein [Streptomyces parvus]TYR63220.1 ATP-binding protein [Streptomyces parvus]